MHLPKSFIERDIKEFTEIGKTAQHTLLGKLANMKSFRCSVIDKQETISPHGDNYCKQVTPEFLPSMAVPDISVQQQVNDNVVKPEHPPMAIDINTTTTS